MKNLELIVVDDGSTDGAVQKLTGSSCGADPRIKIIRQQNRGAAAARNTGLSHASGRWINFIDADDLLHPEKLRHQLDYLKTNPQLMIVSGAWCRFYHEPPAIPQVCADELWRVHTPESWLTAALEHNLMMQPAAWLVKSDLIEKAGPWDETLTLNDDGEYFARILLATDNVGFCAKALSYYRSGIANSLSGGRSPAHFASALSALSSISDQLDAVTDQRTTQQALAKAWTRLAVESYPYAPKVSVRSEAKARHYGEFNPTIGGRWLRRLSRPLGWRTARRLQTAVYALGYRQYGIRRAKKRVFDV